MYRLSVRPGQAPGAELVTVPAFGGVVGALLYFLSLILPESIPAGARSGGVAAFAVFGGMVSEQAFRWIEQQVVKLFPTEASGAQVSATQASGTQASTQGSASQTSGVPTAGTTAPPTAPSGTPGPGTPASRT